MTRILFVCHGKAEMADKHFQVKRGKSRQFSPMIQKMFVCYPGMCIVRMVKTDRMVYNKLYKF